MAANQKPWVKLYQKGIAEEVDVTQYSSINEVMEKSLQMFSDRPAFHNMGKTLTYRELGGQINDFAAYLQHELKLKKGDRVALMMPNILQYPICLFGALKAGMVVVNVNPLYTARELEHQLKDSGAKAIVIVQNFAHVLESVLKKTPIEHIMVTQLGDLLGFPKSLIVNTVVKHVKKMVPAWNLPKAVELTHALKLGKGHTVRPETLTLKDTAFLQYTGGTTGVSKGAVLTHGNIVANMCQAREWIKLFLEPGKEIIITPLPLYHIFSLTANCLVFSSVGALNILVTNPRDFPGFIKELKKWKFTAITGVNTLFNALLNQPNIGEVDFSSLKLTLGGGMAVQKAVAEKWQAVTKVPLIEAYGLTETSPAACINPLDLKQFNGFVGVPIPNTIVTIRDDDGNVLDFDQAGEICISGPQVMKGYYNRDDETAKVMTSDGAFKTGDIGIMNSSGQVKIVDRKKDMILVSGFNVYPNEIEDVLATHPKVLESAAVAVPDDKCGEAPKVFIVKKDASLTEAEVIEFCRKNLTGYKVPKHVEFRTELPKTNVGKILRRELRS